MGNKTLTKSLHYGNNAGHKTKVASFLEVRDLESGKETCQTTKLKV